MRYLVLGFALVCGAAVAVHARDTATRPAALAPAGARPPSRRVPSRQRLEQERYRRGRSLQQV
jgi:hypothetical protein